MSRDFTCMHDVTDAIEALIGAASPELRENLAETIAAYAEDCPDEFFWAIGAQAPVLLHNLVMSIDMASRPDAKSTSQPKAPTKSSRVLRLVDRKPEGTA
jgi:hypothetical protein